MPVAGRGFLRLAVPFAAGYVAAMTARPPEIDRFFAVGSFAVVGASLDRAKYGNKVLRCYQQHGMPVVGVHPKLTAVEGLPCFPNLVAAGGPRAASVVAPPHAAVAIVADAIAAGCRHLWFQPGAADEAAVATARAAGIEVIADGPCVLVALGFRDEGTAHGPGR
jgi:predicted CoA-binding protein